MIQPYMELWRSMWRVHAQLKTFKLIKVTLPTDPALNLLAIWLMAAGQLHTDSLARRCLLQAALARLAVDGDGNARRLRTVKGHGRGGVHKKSRSKLVKSN